MSTFIEGITARGTAFAIGQIVGLLMILWNFVIYVQRDRDRILVCKLIADGLSILQLTLCGAYSGAGVNVVMCAREIVFLNRGRHRWADGKWWLFLFIAVIMAVPFLTGGATPFTAAWWIGVLPALGSGIAVVGLYSKRAYVTRLLSLSGILLWLVYVILLRNWIQIVGNAVSVASITVGLIGDYVRWCRAHGAEESSADTAEGQAGRE